MRTKGSLQITIPNDTEDQACRASYNKSKLTSKGRIPTKSQKLIPEAVTSDKACPKLPECLTERAKLINITIKRIKTGICWLREDKIHLQCKEFLARRRKRKKKLKKISKICLKAFWNLRRFPSKSNQFLAISRNHKSIMIKKTKFWDPWPKER